MSIRATCPTTKSELDTEVIGADVPWRTCHAVLLSRVFEVTRRAGIAIKTHELEASRNAPFCPREFGHSDDVVS